MITYEIDQMSQMIIKSDTQGQKWFIPQDLANADYQAYLRWLNGEEEPNGTL